MSLFLEAESFDSGPDQALYWKRRLREEAAAAASANSHAATLIHAALADAYAGRSRNAGEQAWIAANRLW